MRPKYTDESRYPAGYTKSGATDIRKTFARIRKQQADDKRAQELADAEIKAKVRRIGK